MIRSSLCDYSDTYTLVQGQLITVNNTGTAAAPTNRNKKVTFKNCTPFTDCISKINNTQVDNAKDIDIVMPMYNLTELVTIIQKHLEAYGNIVKVYQL